MLPHNDNTIRRCRPLLGTLVEIESHGNELAIERGFEAIGEVHRRMSFHEETSDLALIRKSPCGALIRVSHHTVTVLRMALALFEESKGLFDISVGRDLVRDGFLPKRGIGWRKARGKLSDLEIVDDCTVRCHRMLLLDLGGIAKGYAVDCAVEAMQAMGSHQGIVNAGGDLRVFGDAATEIALRDADGIVRNIISLRNAALASSSNLHQRKWRMGHRRTVHRTAGGRSIVSDERVSAMAPQCMIADAMTKIAMSNRPMADRMIARRGGELLISSMQGLAS